MPMRIFIVYIVLCLVESVIRVQGYTSHEAALCAYVMWGFIAVLGMLLHIYDAIKEKK